MVGPPVRFGEGRHVPLARRRVRRLDLPTWGTMMPLFDGFDRRMIDIGEVRPRVRVGGSGPELLLLHGHPRTHLMWYAVVPALARHVTVVPPDPRGDGDSTCPPTRAGHAQAATRAMAADGVRLMAELGFDRFAVAGHDRGVRVGYRMALDHPAAVDRLAVLEIVPTGEVFRPLSVQVSRACAGWFFLAQARAAPGVGHRCRPVRVLLRGPEGVVPAGGTGRLPAPYLPAGDGPRRVRGRPRRDHRRPGDRRR